MRRGRRWLTGVAIVAALVAAALIVVVRPGRLPRDIHIVDLDRDLTVTLDGARIEAAPGAVRIASIHTNPYADGGYRRSIVAQPPAVVRLRVPVPEGGALRFATGVARPGRRDPQVAGVRFAVEVEGRELHARTVNPAATRHDRRWFDERVDLSAWAGREVEIALRTAVAGDGAVDGTAGWGSVRITRESRRARQAASPQAPNVLVLLIDTLRADSLGCYGATPSPSPHLDRLASEGVLFARTMAQSSWTMPTVATLFTGLYPRSHGVVGGSCLWGAGDDHKSEIDEPACAYLADALPTLAEQAEHAGITTFGVSANPLVSRGSNLARGFETFVEFIPKSKWKDLSPAADVNDAFLDWLGPNRGRRFFAYLHYVDPHHPYQPPPPFAVAAPAGLRPTIAKGDISTIANDVNLRGAAGLGDPEIAHLRALYRAEIRYWDSELARLRQALAALGVADSTILIVIADHGEEFQDHGALLHGTHLYEEQIHVPFLIAGPGIPARKVETLVQQIDFFPTIARLLGLPPRPELPGHDLLDRNGAAPRPAIAETRHAVRADGDHMEILAVRTDGWKLIHTPRLGRFELYDLTRDPAERDNRYETAAEGATLARTLAAWQAAAPPAPVAAGADPQLREKLRALGYVQ